MAERRANTSSFLVWTCQLGKTRKGQERSEGKGTEEEGSKRGQGEATGRGSWQAVTVKVREEGTKGNGRVGMRRKGQASGGEWLRRYGDHMRRPTVYV